MKTLYPFQQDAVDFLSTRNGILGDECGLGKTVAAIEVIKLRRKRAKTSTAEGPILVVCPKSVKRQWLNEIDDQCPDDPIIVTGVAGRMPDHEPGEPWELRWLFHPRANSWVIMHYEGIQRQYKELVKCLWSSIICDEAHRIKNRRAKRSIYLKLLRADHRLALTGTPMHKNPAELWSLLQWLYPDHFRSYWQFFEEFVRYEEHPFHGYKQITGVKNEKRLGEIMGPIFLRRTKHEVAPDLPPRIDTRVEIDMLPAQQKLYDKIKKAKDIEVPLEGQDLSLLIPNVLAKLTRLQQVLVDPSMTPLNQHLPSAKLEWIRDYIGDNPGIPMLIFSKFRAPVLRLAEEFDTALHVGAAGKKMGSGVEDFIYGTKDILCGTIDALGEGLDLGRASRAIFLECHWSTQKMQQAYDRIHRITAVEPKHIITLHTANTVDSLVEKSLKQGWSTQDLVFKALKQWEEV